MENFPKEYSKLADETKNHLSLQTIAAYINIPDKMNDNEKQLISDHLVECSICMSSFNHIFDENLRLDGNKTIINLFRQILEKEDEIVLFKSEDNLIEIELTSLSATDFNLRFTSLPSYQKNEKGAIKANDKYILRFLAMNTETMFIIHSEVDIMDLETMELDSLAHPIVVPLVDKKEKPANGKKYFLYAAALIIVFAAVVIIYNLVRSTELSNIQDDQKKFITDLTPGQKPIRDSDTASSEHGSPDKISGNVQQTALAEDMFVTNGILEHEIGKINNGNSQVEIISPSIGSEIRMPQTFEWVTAKKNLTLKFVILNNRNVPVYNSLINGLELTIDTKLIPGLYYWKLESSDKIEAVGKFIIR